MDKVIAEMSPEQLAKFKLHNECASHAKTKLEYANSQVAIQTRDAEITRLKAEVYRYSECVRKFEAHERAVKEYQEFRNKLSSELGVELEGKSICPLTGRVFDVAQSKPKE
jgi:hypothetical protein